MTLTPGQVDEFVERGAVRLEEAFPRSLALRCQQRLWDQLAPMVPDDPATWDRPVARLPSQETAPFREAVASGRWLAAIARLAGPAAVAHPHLAGSVAVRFPVAGDPGDDGWHLDTSFRVDGDDDWWVNHRSRGRALLMLVLFSEVGEDDAPTRMRVGSHRDVARGLVPHGDAGLPSAATGPLVAATADRPVALATGGPGDVVLCHPFLVHAAQAHRGTAPRFLAQPGVLLDGGYPPGDPCPVARALP